MNIENVRSLTQQAAEEHIQALEYLDVVETAEAEEMDMSDEELRAAHILALKARVIVSADLPPSKQRLLDTAEEVTTGVIEVISQKTPSDEELENTWPGGRP